MATTLSTLRAELEDRGFNYLTTARIDRYINRAYNELCEAADWPFLQASQSGTSPQTITDVRQVLTVRDTTNNNSLDYWDRRILQRSVQEDLTTDTGSPYAWYWDSDGVVRSYPENSGVTLEIIYLKTPSLLVNTDDEVIVPDRYAYIIVDGAARKAYQDSDNFEAAGAIQQEWNLQVEQMRMNLMYRNLDSPTLVERRRLHEEGIM